MTKMINLTIDDRPISVPAGMLVVDAAKQIGNDIPVFCYHPKMEPVGMCRMCLVEIGRPAIDRATNQVIKNEDGTPKIAFGPKLETACTTPVSEGMVVRTNNAKVEDARRDVLEFLLTSHPLDCPVCDKGGECPLQNLTLAHGPGKSRFLYDEKLHLAKHYPLGDQIFLDRERCIQCARCVRFQSDIAGDPVLGFTQRGRAIQITTHSEPGFDSYFSGNTTDICPVGALTTADFRFGARPWELKQAASICTHCPVGCNLTLNVRREAVSGGGAVVKRVMPRQNEEVNETWICDKGRWAYHFAESKERISEPMIRRNGELVKATWEEALALTAQRMKIGPGSKALFLAGGRLANEDLFNLHKLASSLNGQSVLYSDMAGGDWTARIGLPAGSNIGAMGAETTMIVIACDLENEAPLWYLRVRQAAKRGAKLIVANARPTKLDSAAKQVVRYTYGNETAALSGLATELGAEEGNVVIFFGSDGLGLAGTRALADACAGLLLDTHHTGRPNNGLVGVWPKANQQGAWDMGFTPVDDLPAALAHASLIHIAAADPAGDSPALAQALEASRSMYGSFIVVQELFLTATARLADVVLPAQSFIEREGTFTSGERRVQRFYPAVSATNRGPKADYKIAAEIAARLGLDIEGRAASLVMQRIAAEAPGYAGLTYPLISQVKPQWPIVHRADLYYGGASYENTQGLGVTLQPGQALSDWAPAAAPAIPALKQDEVLLIPVTRLYDCGVTVASSSVLQSRIARPAVWLHPATAEAAGLADCDHARLALDGADAAVQVKLDATLPEGLALLPRSAGLPVSAPQAVKLLRPAAAPAKL